MYRDHNCGELRIENVGKQVKLSGWVQKSRDLGGMTFIDLRDRYGITQLIFNLEKDSELCLNSRKLGREFVITVDGIVNERSNKNKKIPTGEIEIDVNKLEILNESLVPPFTIEDKTDGGEDLRMKFRYLDIRRNPVKDNLILRHKMSIEIRNYLNSLGFIEVETPALIKSTPEGARDFLVPSRLSQGTFYALPQSPQTFKQLLMIGGLDKYYQIVKCFRDEDFRADRQPEFTQIDCEMSFVTEEDIINTFEGLTANLFKNILNIDINKFPRIKYSDALKYYGTDSPDFRFDMKFVELNDVAQGKGFKVFDDSELIVGINAKECAGYSRKQLDKLTDFVKTPQVGAKGLVYVKYNEDGSLKSSVDKFFTQDDLKEFANKFEAKQGDLLLIISGNKNEVRKALSVLRLEMGDRLELRKKDNFSAVWVVDFPLFEWDEENKKYHAMHHPFTSPKEEDLHLLETNPEKVQAKAYDLVINGVEVGGGSIRIHNKEIQQQMLKAIGFSDDEANKQFGFLMNAFKYGAPPHGGIAFGFDRLCTLFGQSDSIRNFIAFPKNNAGKDIMIDSPSKISSNQLNDLGLKLL
ncbi:MAG: aspartate--tRNA ligase [Bacteroidota bacterium]|nr:aspartate--tRNA ligase [Bacteroidota bacterium]